VVSLAEQRTMTNMLNILLKLIVYVDISSLVNCYTIYQFVNSNLNSRNSSCFIAAATEQDTVGH
jgi:hypothetical protein